MARALNNHPQIIFASDLFFEFFKMARNIWFRNQCSDFNQNQPLEDYFNVNESYYSDFHRFFDEIKFSQNDMNELKTKIPRTAEPFFPKILPSLNEIRSGFAFQVLD